jgi:hypothetical protein
MRASGRRLFELERSDQALECAHQRRDDVLLLRRADVFSLWCRHVERRTIADTRNKPKRVGERSLTKGLRDRGEKAGDP